MLNVKQIYKDSVGTGRMLHESIKTHMNHLFEDGTMTFDDIRKTFQNVFAGKVRVTSKVNSVPLSITYKDGNFMLANDKHTVKEPFSIDKVCQKCKCTQSPMKDSLSGTMTNFLKVLGKLDQKLLNSIFANGQNYYSFNVVVPDADQFKNYSGKCFIQHDKVNCYDSTFNKVQEDEEGTRKLQEVINANVGLLNANPEISKDNFDRLKNSVSPECALKTVLAKLDSLVDGIGYKATVNDYIHEKYANLIVNVALKHGIDLYRNSDFVNELVARLSHISGRKPNRADLVTYAKRDGIDYKAPAYREFVQELESTMDETNMAITRPIEQMMLTAGILLLRCFVGLVSSDPRHSALKLQREIVNAIETLREDQELTPENIKCLRHCMKNLDSYQSTLPQNGVLVTRNGKIYSLKGEYGAINNLMKMFNY